MDRVPDPLIERLTDGLEPVRSYARRDGLLLVAAAMLVTALVAGTVEGFSRAGLSGSAAPIFYIGAGLLAVLGASATFSVVAMASPHVGNRYEGPMWALAMVAVLPATVLLSWSRPGHGPEPVVNLLDLHCVIGGIAASLLIAVSMVIWLRRGAPVAPARAGLLAGIAASAIGMLVASLTCPNDTVGHIGFWHTMPVAAGALLGRILLPPLLRW